ncbi:MAG: 23S rRNA (guanosine(2251)-2'-O)-methyltransferase RlmB [Erysipelotrichaceae bacterium]|jgi:23S rRNA (guanosine2251-2'-O)-methyltransferase|nr:23S rRNA (guanosine(2251)-2'-O)-methyltransferase RlmB [Erysipelotrichaceae bacterium]
MPYITSKNAIKASIQAKTLLKLYYLESAKWDQDLAGVPFEVVDKKTFFLMIGNEKHHQGIVAKIKDFAYTDFKLLITKSRTKRFPFLVILDEITDANNFGAIIRTAEAFGVDGIIIKKDHQIDVNPTVQKISTGACNFIPITRVTNLNTTIKTLKEQGYWIVACEADGDTTITEVDVKRPLAVILGSEGFGVSSLVRKNSDYVVKIPMMGEVNSLNVSVAFGVVVSYFKLQQ